MDWRVVNLPWRRYNTINITRCQSKVKEMTANEPGWPIRRLDHFAV